MDAGINNVIYMELNSGPKIANSTCGKTIVAGTIDRGSTVLLSPECDLNSSTKVHVGIKKRLTVTTTGNLTCEINISSIFTTVHLEI